MKPTLVESIDPKTLPIFVKYYDKYTSPTDPANTYICAVYCEEEYSNQHQTICRIVEESELTQFLKEYT